jgi:Protein of unknown function (DUF4232)
MSALEIQDDIDEQLRELFHSFDPAPAVAMRTTGTHPGKSTLRWALGWSGALTIFLVILLWGFLLVHERSDNTASPETAVAPGASHHVGTTVPGTRWSVAPLVTATPASGLHNGEPITVHLEKYKANSTFFLSECASATNVSTAGCGDEIESQTFGVTDEFGRGSVTFYVSSTATNAPGVSSPSAPCKAECVIVLSTLDIGDLATETRHSQDLIGVVHIAFANPSQTSSTTPNGAVPECRKPQLRLTDSGGVAGPLATETFRLTNTSDSTCYLMGYIHAVFTSYEGGPEYTVPERFVGGFGFAVSIPSTPPFVILWPGESASGDFDYTADGGMPSCTAPTYGGLVVSFPPYGTLLASPGPVSGADSQCSKPVVSPVFAGIEGPQSQ